MPGIWARPLTARKLAGLAWHFASIKHAFRLHPHDALRRTLQLVTCELTATNEPRPMMKCFQRTDQCSVVMIHTRGSRSQMAGYLPG